MRYMLSQFMSSLTIVRFSYIVAVTATILAFASVLVRMEQQRTSMAEVNKGMIAWHG
jgi:hypothetical protein